MTTLKMPMFCEIELKDEKNCGGEEDSGNREMRKFLPNDAEGEKEEKAEDREKIEVAINRFICSTVNQIK